MTYTCLNTYRIDEPDQPRWNLLSIWSKWKSDRRAVKELSALSDVMLKDMGLHRSEVESCVFGDQTGRRR